DEDCDGRVPCGEDQPYAEADRGYPRRDAVPRVQGSEEERRLRPSGLRQAGAREPQGADRAQPSDRRAHQDPGQAGVQVPSREEPEGRGAWQEVGLDIARGALNPTPPQLRHLLQRPFRGSGRESDTGPCRTPRWPVRSSISPPLPGPPRMTSPSSGWPRAAATP